MNEKSEFFKAALAAMDRGEEPEGIGPFLALARKIAGGRARHRSDVAADVAQQVFEELLAARRKRNETWTNLLACDEAALKAMIGRRIRWRLGQGDGRDPDFTPIHELEGREEPAADEDVERKVRREHDGRRIARWVLAELTERERAVLEQWVELQDVSGVARRLGIARSTAYEALKSVRGKLARSRDGAAPRRRGGRVTTSRGTRAVALRELLALVTSGRGRP